MEAADRELGEKIGVIRKGYTEDKKSLLNEMGIRINKQDSPSLFERLKLTVNGKGKVNGAEFDKVKVIVLRGKRLEYTVDASKTAKLNEFKELVKVAEERHAKTAEGLVEEKITDVPPNEDLTRSVLHDSIESLENFIDDKEGEVNNWLKNPAYELTNEEDREVRGLLELDLPTKLEEEGNIGINGKIDFAKIEEGKWQKKYGEEKNPQKKLLFKSLVKLAKLKADYFRLVTNQRPETEEVQSIVEEEIQNGTLRRFQKFKEWSKKNLAGLSVVAISVAGIVTTIVMGAKTAIKKGASATGKFAKALAKVAEKAVPVIGALLNLTSKLLTLGAKGINFLSNNLWLLAVAITYALYEKRKKHTK